MTQLAIGDISDLLDVVERTRHHPKLKLIHDEAMKQLEAIAEDLAPKPEELEPPAPPEPYGAGEPEKEPVVYGEEDRRA